MLGIAQDQLGTNFKKTMKRVGWLVEHILGYGQLFYLVFGGKTIFYFILFFNGERRTYNIYIYINLLINYKTLIIEYE